MSFGPRITYLPVEKNFLIKDFHDYPTKYITRPPYQRKSVWKEKKQQALMDSLIRRYYVPRLVMRAVRFSDDKEKYEVIDGQQRITTVQEFFNNRYKLPETLSDIGENLGKDLKDMGKRLVGYYYKDLDADVREFIDKELEFKADVIHKIDEPRGWDHQKIAIGIFERLQEGVSLNFMEKTHAKLSSKTRQFITKYADDESFDYEKYEPIDDNPKMHKFFEVLDVNNDRMLYAQFMARFLLIQKYGSSANLSQAEVEKFISKKEYSSDEIPDYSFENEKVAKETLKNLDIMHEIFKEGMTPGKEKGSAKELSKEHFVYAVYLLVSFLREEGYVIDEEVKVLVREFVKGFYHDLQKTNKEVPNRINWIDSDDMVEYRENIQLQKGLLEVRDRIVKPAFFRYVHEQDKEMTLKDSKRFFDDWQRMEIYRKFNGICQICKVKVDKDFDADHKLAYSKGGKTIMENAQLLCSKCNRKKGAN